MARAASLEHQLRELERLAESLHAPAAREQLRGHLASRASVVVARAARLAAAADRDWTPDLVAAFRRFMADPTKTDKGCLAKVALVEALLAG